MDIHAQLAIVRRWLPLLVGTVVIAAAAAYGLSSVQPKVYEARALLIVGEALSGVNPDYNQLLVSQRLSETYARIATTHDVLADAIKTSGIDDSPEGLASRLSVSTSQDTALLTITARDSTAAGAAAIANAVARGLIDASPAVTGQEQELVASVERDIAAIRTDLAATQTQIEDLLAIAARTPAEEATLQSLQNRLVSLRSTFATLLSFASGQTANLLTIVQPALTPESPIAPRPLLDAILAATIALLLVAAFAFIFEYFDDAVRNPEQVMETLGLPTLGIIETIPGGKGRRFFYRLTALLNPRSPTAEAYRTLRANLEFASVDGPLRSLLIASAVPGEGKTVTASNLALVVAQSGRRVLLLDADLRRPGIHRIFDLPNTRGLTDLIRSPAVLPESVIQPTEQANLLIMTSGPLPPNPTEILASSRTRSLIERLVAAYDLVIIDSPPVQLFADAAVLSSYLDGTLLVVESRRGRRTRLRHTLEGLERAGATILGVVLNRAPGRGHPEYGYYYESPDGAVAVAWTEPTAEGAASVAPPAVGSLAPAIGARSTKSGRPPSSIEPR